MNYDFTPEYAINPIVALLLKQEDDTIRRSRTNELDAWISRHRRATALLLNVAVTGNC